MVKEVLGDAYLRQRTDEVVSCLPNEVESERRRGKRRRLLVGARERRWFRGGGGGVSATSTTAADDVNIRQVRGVW